MRNFELKHVILSNEYRKKWNVHSLNDFYFLIKNGERINDTLYRKGGLGDIDTKDDYFLILKHTEAFYSDDITTDETRKRYLKSQWCIIDKDGNEKVIFDNFVTPYLSGGQIYSVDHKYYNIETGYFYGYSYGTISSDTFIFFINNTLEKDKTKRGVIKINKFDGTFELFQ